MSACRGIRWFRPYFFRLKLLISNSTTSFPGVQRKRANKIHSVWKTNYVPSEQPGLNILLRIRGIRCPGAWRDFLPLISLDFASTEGQIRSLNKLWGVPFAGADQFGRRLRLGKRIRRTIRYIHHISRNCQSYCHCLHAQVPQILP